MESMMDLQQKLKMDKILLRLQSPDSDERRWAIYDLDTYESSDIIDILANSIQDENRAVREAASEILEIQASDICTPKLIPLLGSQRIEVRNVTASVLVKYGQSAVKDLIDALVDPNEDVRKFSADILGLARNPEAIADLCKSALEDEVNTVAVSSIEALGKIGGLSALPTLYEIFDRQQGMEAEAVEAIGLIGGEASVEFLSKRLEHADPIINFAIIDAFGNLGQSSGLPALYKFMLNAPDYLEEHISQAILKIGQIANCIVLKESEKNFMNRVLNSLASGDDEVTALVLHQFTLGLDEKTLAQFFRAVKKLPSNIIVGLIRHAKGFEGYNAALIDLVKHEDDWVAYSALESFYQIPQETSVPVLLDILQNYNGLRLLAAMRVVDSMNLVQAQAVLQGLLEDEQDEIRIEAQRILDSWAGK